VGAVRRAGRRLLVLAGALLLDRLLGEPPERAHPVVWIGAALSFMTKNAPEGKRARLVYGTYGVGAISGGSALLASLVPRAGGRRHGLCGAVFEAWLLKTCLSHRGLEEAVMAVARPLEAGDTEGARSALRSLVGRDRSSLDGALISAAAIESLAENLSDSLTAPLLYYALFGLPGAFFYRATNTADAMVGYRTEEFEELGKFAARLDDALNLLPARLTALALVAASGPSWRAAFETLRRDRGETESPNAGWPMSAAAGALGVVLEKRGHYVLNPGGRAPEARDVRAAVSLCRRAAVSCALVTPAFVLLRNRLRLDPESET
jgi:adenosylcobinamide-phosphate synthase